jgi:hypothetical protein
VGRLISSAVAEALEVTFIEPIVDRLLSAGLASPGELVGCSETEIAGLERALSLRFPAAYREFLMRMGRRAGELFVGSDYFVDRLHVLQDGARNLLAEMQSDFVLPESALVILMHQGYVFFFLDVSEGSDDPPVFRFVESDKVPSKVADRFTQFLADCVEDTAEIVAETEAYRKRQGLSEYR